MSLGKLTPAELERLITPRLGAQRDEVLLGPGPGVDCAIVRIGAGRVMAITTDPLSLIPALGPARSARLACHLITSDLWTSGIPPAYAAVNLNLPPHISENDLDEYWGAMSEEWVRLGVAVVTGHSGRYAGCDYTILGAATVIGTGDEGRYVGPRFVAPGDRILVTKGCAFEATAIVAQLFPLRLREHLDEEGLERARGWIDQVSVVAECRAAILAGVRDQGVSALHDATEGGILGGLIELAHACKHDLRVARDKIPLSMEARAACQVLGIDPYWALSEGTLIIAVRPHHAERVLAAVSEASIPVVDVGDVARGTGALWLTEPDGKVVMLTEPLRDPYWEAYEGAVRAGWK